MCGGTCLVRHLLFSHADGGLHPPRHTVLKARTKIREHVLRDLLFADDCALIAHTIEDTNSGDTKTLKKNLKSCKIDIQIGIHGSRQTQLEIAVPQSDPGI